MFNEEGPCAEVDEVSLARPFDFLQVDGEPIFDQLTLDSGLVHSRVEQGISNLGSGTQLHSEV